MDLNLKPFLLMKIFYQKVPKKKKNEKKDGELILIKINCLDIKSIILERKYYIFNII